MRCQRHRWAIAMAIVVAVAYGESAFADWPTLRGSVERTGLSSARVERQMSLSWAREFAGERLGTAMEPIVAAGRVFVATHSGNLYALDAEDGDVVWQFVAGGAFLQSPSVEGDVVVAGNAGGELYGLDVATGKLRWKFDGCRGGFSASPAIADGMVLIGARSGEFVALELATGNVRWRQSLGAPIRQSAAIAGSKVYIMTEAMTLHALEVSSGRTIWVSDSFVGQTARDYYPVVVKSGDRELVLVRSNPILSMGIHIGRDRQFLCRNAGVDDSGWQKVDAWIKSDAARGNESLWEKEQKAIVQYLGENRLARTFFVVDGDTGKETERAPMLWVAGCQAVGAQPALTSDGRLLVFYRSAYGNWNHGVAPLVALGLWNPVNNRIGPLFHQHGKQPAWNTFWGTADESQNFTVAGDTVIIVHQGTLSGFDLKRNQLFHIWGNRDTFGGFQSPAWARNEWHGPGRGGVALSDGRIYWITGSRLLCLEPGRKEGDVFVETVQSRERSGGKSERGPEVSLHLQGSGLADELSRVVEEAIGRRWAPLFVEPGLSGRDFSFESSGEIFESLAWSYPHLTPAVARRVKEYLAQEWSEHPPFANGHLYSLKEGERREWFWTPEEVWVRIGQDKPPHSFGNIHAIWLYAERCGEWDLVMKEWQGIRRCFEDFEGAKWRLDDSKGDLYANRYLASLRAFVLLAERAGDSDAAGRARRAAEETEGALIGWWKRAGTQGTLTAFKGVGELDPFIGKGDGLSFRVAPHRHKVALLLDLTPEIAETVKSAAPEAVESVWRLFDTLYRTWYLAGEERQVHFGENFVDPPDLALSGFRGLVWLQGAPAAALASRIDLPACKADLYYATKIALALEGLHGH